MTVFDLGSLHLITDRPNAAPAPWPAGDGPQDPPIPTGPWAPTEQPTVDELIARSRQAVAELNAATEKSRQARGADTGDVLDDIEQALAAIRRPLVLPTPITDPALREVA